MLVQCWPTVSHAGPALYQHWVNDSINGGTMLANRLRRWPCIVPALGECLCLLLWPALRGSRCNGINKHAAHVTCSIFIFLGCGPCCCCCWSGAAAVGGPSVVCCLFRLDALSLFRVTITRPLTAAADAGGGDPAPAAALPPSPGSSWSAGWPAPSGLAGLAAPWPDPREGPGLSGGVFLAALAFFVFCLLVLAAGTPPISGFFVSAVTVLSLTTSVPWLCTPAVPWLCTPAVPWLCTDAVPWLSTDAILRPWGEVTISCLGAALDPMFFLFIFTFRPLPAVPDAGRSSMLWSPRSRQQGLHAAVHRASWAYTYRGK